MHDVGGRLLEVLAAALLAGAIMVLYSGMTGIWNYGFLFIVPTSLMWSMLLGMMVVVDISTGWLLLLAVASGFAVYLAARFARPRLLRIGLETAIFLALAIGFPALFAMTKIVV